MIRRAILTLVVAALIAVALEVSPAAAGPCRGEGRIDDDGGVVAGWCEDASPAGRASSMQRLWDTYCAHTTLGAYRDADRVEFTRERIVAGDELDDVNGDPDRDYGIFVVTCRRGDEFVQWDPLIWELTAPVDPTALRDAAVARIDPPSPSVATSPAIGVPAVVDLDTWLWIDDPWSPLVESEVQGGVAVEVVASPTSVRWDFGDGGAVVCAGPGVVWSETAGSTDCAHRFDRSSAGQPGDAYASTVTVTWTLTWSLNGTDQGSFGTLDRSAALAVAVAETQAIGIWS